MQLSAYSDCALRVLIQAALRYPSRVTVDEVAGTFGLSRHPLVKIVHDLGRHSYLQTQRGIGGGFTLARPPGEIRIGDVVRFCEGGEAVIDCIDKPGQACRLSPACRLQGVLAEASAGFFAVLDRHTLADLVKQPARLREVLQIA